MSNMIARRKMINEILSRYGDFLAELCRYLNASGLHIDLPGLRSRAVILLDEKLSENELSALNLIAGGLYEKFPGVDNRIKQLLRKEITDYIRGHGK